MIEVWEAVNGTEGLYLISNFGRVASTNFNKSKKLGILTDFINNHGYKRVSLYAGGKILQRSVHRLVAEHFIPNDDYSLDVNHIDCDKTNNRLSNLEWVTRRRNIDHAMENKIHCHGETSGASILKEKQVLDIRDLYAKGVVSQRRLAAMYKVSRGCITGIIKNRNWRHI